MLEFCQVFADADQTWLTVGDHYGHDAQRLVSLGISRVSASSLSTEYLQSIMNREGIIDVLNINAEEIDLKDNCFDYVVCKEALHHMARPYCAVYEMLRIAKKGVFIVAEPCDPLIDWRSEGKPRKFERTFGIDPIVGPNVTYRDVSNEFQMSRYIDWWETGAYNYVYTVSEREIAKLAQGYGVLTWATKPLGDFYSAEFASQDAKDESKGFEETKTQIKLQELLSSISGIPAPRLHGLLFKEPPNQQITSKLSEIGFTFNKTRTRFLPLTWPNDLELGP
jgi:ubiquinone/menaquinone biosynthesis C-methylase UbiE